MRNLAKLTPCVGIEDMQSRYVLYQIWLLKCKCVADNHIFLNNCRRHEKCEKFVETLHTSVCLTERCREKYKRQRNEEKSACRRNKTKYYQEQQKSETKVPSARIKGIPSFLI